MGVLWGFGSDSLPCHFTNCPISQPPHHGPPIVINNSLVGFFGRVGWVGCSLLGSLGGYRLLEAVHEGAKMSCSLSLRPRQFFFPVVEMQSTMDSDNCCFFFFFLHLILLQNI